MIKLESNGKILNVLILCVSFELLLGVLQLPCFSFISKVFGGSYLPSISGSG